MDERQSWRMGKMVMNAYELADELDKINDIPIETIINMLRQQADQIAELEKVNQLNDEVLKPMLIDCIKRNLSVIDANLFFAQYDSVRGTKECTTPQTKPLSDADIQQISHRYHYTYNPDYVGFAKAIEERHGIK